jgi:hypothetical protein
MDWSLAKCGNTPTFSDLKQHEQKRFCRGCFIKDQCLQYALDNPERTAGIVYGGLTPSERSKILKMLPILKV